MEEEEGGEVIRGERDGRGGLGSGICEVCNVRVEVIGMVGVVS